MNTENNNTWSQANQEYLMAAFGVIDEEIKLYFSNQPKEQTPLSFIEKIKQWLKNLLPDKGISIMGKDTLKEAQERLVLATYNMKSPAAIDTLTAIFGLTPFEKKILLLCAGIELDTQFGKRIAYYINGQASFQPTFSLSLAAFPDAHWNALSPNSPLRYWRLIELNNGLQITKNGLKIDERILHYLTGVTYIDEKLREVLDIVVTDTPLVQSQKEVVHELVSALSAKSNEANLPIIQLSGEDKEDKIAIASASSAMLGINLYRISTHNIPINPREISDLARLWNREAALGICALFLDDNTLDLNDKTKLQAIMNFIDHVQGILILSNGEWAKEIKRTKIEFTIKKPTTEEQRFYWKTNLGEWAKYLDKDLDNIISQFNLNAKTIESIITETLTRYPKVDKEQAPTVSKAIWTACCKQTRPKIDELAQRIQPVATWKDIVLPEIQEQLLREITAQVKHRKKVYNDWGFSAMGMRGLGISVLFTGESGTGKTMASEVLANELNLDLYRIDLSQVVNKYIGETEKNLKRIFDAAEEGGAILLFDEADALFGKRSDVKDSHDRYSNIEVSYLLQRMESYGGLAVLTTNMKNAIDKAFLRRIRFVIQFPYPDADHREEIWKRVFPAKTPKGSLDYNKLAKLNIAGGNIKNIALNAAFMAAMDDKPVSMLHILQASKGEYNKLDKTLSSSEISGWQ